MEWLAIFLVVLWLVVHHVNGRRNKRMIAEGRPEEIICPACGYWCLGKGGIGCVDKPKLCGLDGGSEG